MIEPKPQFLSVQYAGSRSGKGTSTTTDADRKTQDIAYLATPSQRSDGAGLFWLSGFHSVMTSTKVSFLADYALDQGLGMTRFDYSGHGLSPGDIEDGVISDWLDEAWEMFTRVASGPQVLIGSSMGGWLALLLVRRMQEQQIDVANRLRGIVMIAPAWDMTERLMWTKMPDAVRTQITTEGVWDRPSHYGDGPYPITKHLIEDGRTHLLDGTQLTVPCPVRILHGMQDPDVPWQGSAELADLLGWSNVHLHLIGDGEHRLSRDEDLRELVRAIEAVAQTE